MRRDTACWLLLATSAVLVGCKTFHPQPMADVPFLEHAQTRSDGDLSVTAAVLSREHSKAVFGVDLEKKGIQPVFVRVENHGTGVRWLLPVAMDPDYFSPYEAAWVNHFFWSGLTNDRMDKLFYDLHKREECPPGVSEGFVYTNLDLGMKYVNAVLIGRDKSIVSFEFVLEAPGLRLDVERVDRDTLYAEEDYRSVDLDQLRAAIETLPPCTLGDDLQTPGDPINIVLVGHPEDLLTAFASRGWHLTETVYGGSAMKTTWSTLFGSEYKYSPVSPLYVYGRPQDIALQKARSTVDERNHLRLWLSPLRYEGRDVYVGQISRDIGVRMSSRSLVTHKIDPNLDEVRAYLFQDLLLSHRLEKLGLLPGVGAASPEEPRLNYTRDPYFTDGRRAVFFVSDDIRSLAELELLDWE